MNYELSLPYSMSCRIHCNGTYRCLLLTPQISGRLCHPMLRWKAVAAKTADV